MENSNWKNILSNDEWRDLKLSVGTHKSSRRLNPIEVAKLIKKLRDKNVPYEFIKDELILRDVTVIKRFEILLESLPEKYHNKISFGRKNGYIPFTTAAFLTRLESRSEIDLLYNEISTKNLTKNEIQQIIELKKRSDMNISECIEEILKSRLIVEKRNMLIGKIYEDKITSVISDANWDLLNNLFLKFLKESFPNTIFYSTRISKERFIIVTDIFGQSQIELKANKENLTFEKYIRNNFINWLRDNYE